MLSNVKYRKSQTKLPVSESISPLDKEPKNKRIPSIHDIPREATPRTIFIILVLVYLTFKLLSSVPSDPNHPSPVQTQTQTYTHTDKDTKFNTIADDVSEPNDESRGRVLVNEIRQEFYNRYGGEKEALALLSKGIISPGNGIHGKYTTNDIEHIAARILHRKALDDDFVMAFGGYSVTVGRGNHFDQSFPFILQTILSPLWKSLGINLVVRNAAIGGIPSFPYGWCLPNYLGEGADVISWDFAMNEGNSADGLEAYLRNSVMLHKRRGERSPMFIMLDQKRARLNVLKTYADLDYFPDAIAVSKGEIVPKKYLEMKEDERPEGYKHWDIWGAPDGSPGQSSWHPKYMEHELIGWIIAMHFLKGFECALDIMERDNIDWEETYRTLDEKHMLPKPIHDPHSSLFFGVPVDDNHWKMNHVACRTNFLPRVQGSITDTIISGIASSVDTTEEILNERGDGDYEDGWLLDVGRVEKLTKKKVLQFGGLGYIDMKVALYGKASSGILELFLPYEKSDALHQHLETRTKADLDAEEGNQWISKIVVCEVNEKRGENECDVGNDMSFSVGGVEANVKKMPEVQYLKKEICIEMEVPKGARLSTRKEIVGQRSPKQTQDDIGLEVKIFVNNPKVNHEDGACNIAHIIWENIEEAKL